MENVSPLGEDNLWNPIVMLSESVTSKVWLAKHRLTGEEAVIKCFDLSKLNRNLRSSLDSELEFLSSVDHPNIIRLLQVFQDGDFLIMVLEHCDGGTLSSYIQRHGRVEEHIARRFMKQIGAGLEIIHDNHIIHRDLKPENILLAGSGDESVLKIADFSFARKLLPGKYLETVCGSPLYMAPEVLQFQRYNEKADMWSVGAILFELLHGYPPFGGMNNVQVLRKIKSSTSLPFSRLILQQLHPDCIDVCSRLLSSNPAQVSYTPPAMPSQKREKPHPSLSFLRPPARESTLGFVDLLRDDYVEKAFDEFYKHKFLRI